MKLNVFTTITGLVLGGIAMTAVAGSGMDSSNLTKEQQQLLTKLDANHDGVISQEEAKANPALAARFSEIDANSDGRIEQAEFARFEVSSDDSGGMDK